VLWILHQFRTEYELWDHPLGDLIHGTQRDRGFVTRSEKRTGRSFRGPPGVFQIPPTSLQAEVLLWFRGRPHFTIRRPGQKNSIRPTRRLFFLSSRLCLQKGNHWYWKRSRLRVNIPFELFFGGCRRGLPTELTKLADHLGLETRVEWLGYIATIGTGALCKGPGDNLSPIDEDFGYVTLEGMLARKPVVVCSDSGGPLEFVATSRTD